VVTGAALTLLVILMGGSFGPPAPAAPTAPARPAWPSGHEMPLPISVKTPQDLVFKSEAERQYLIFNLMAGGRLAYEAGDYHQAVREWETLLKVPNVPTDVSRAVSPLLEDARRQQAATPSAAAPASTAAHAPLDAATGGAGAAGTPPARPPAAAVTATTVAGTVVGGGSIGPGAAVLWLERLDGPTPRPRLPPKPRVVDQAGKAFVPHVLAIGVGETVDFKNGDPFFHNVFSLSPGQHFDAGLYDGGHSYLRTFTRSGPVELLCNIHASMLGYLYVVDSAYYAQPRSNGTFTIRSVPPGRYRLNAWHESSANVVRQAVTVGPEGARGLVVRINGDRAPLVAVPDTYGKPRQPQLGY
jgi:plastocyanin